MAQSLGSLSQVAQGNYFEGYSMQQHIGAVIIQIKILSTIFMFNFHIYTDTPQIMQFQKARM